MRIAAAITGLVVALAVLRSLDPVQAGTYADAVYVPLMRVANAAVAPAPWSWTAILLVTGAVAMGALVLRRGFRTGLLVLTLCALAAWTWGTAVWGIHYQRASWADRRGLPAEASPGDVASLARHLREALAEAVVSLPPAGRDPDAALVAISASLERRTLRDDGLAVEIPARVKVVPPGLLLGFGTSGVVSPWLLEAHVDGGLPDAARVAVGAHELAHLAGHAREDDAEAAGVIAGLQATDPFARYAVALFALAAVARDLPPDERQLLLDSLPGVARDDLDATRRAAERYVRPSLAAAQRGLYDRYLRAQGIPEGTQSYARSTSLLARALAAGELTGITGGPPPRLRVKPPP